MRPRLAQVVLCAGVALAGAPRPARAVPPLVAGDVPTADKGVAEVYVGTRYQRTGSIERQAPFTETVLGISRWQELTFEIPYLSVSPSQGSPQSGWGDAVVGTKLMFLRETQRLPGMAVSLEAKLDNADERRELGSGAVDYDLRWRAQKQWGWFTALGNLGYTFVGEQTVDGVRQERRDVWFWAFAQEYEVASKTKLLSELYWNNSDTPGDPGRLAADIGFKQSLLPWLQFHAAVGKSLREMNIGGPRVRIYAGVKIEFPAFAREKGP